ncbi:TetR/AcrR family transcriptional regulator [Alkalihalobacillus sp. MEB130]|uniref:TetR/AcrR family transcriptional regulator n=1 Tax=Alkalihalobacillus sp. MEB130 TaxID=2976704 RepID=UPI0028DED3EF|nr:TetR/AcrR family transcriptional regulator [Alkalihalobacillus sp. MEB130]MDT8861383.1 TetR/AcrR family transcriptional regulator [Alkalihalobacillus sp. MEB130]
MNDRKQHVINMSHKLFVEKGFQATSIQDILEYSGISKGTFYNYFSSKNELIMALFRTFYKKMEKERNELLIGEDPSDIEIFVKQFEFQLNTNKKNKVFTLYEEVLFSTDEELKAFIKRGQIRTIQWVYRRFQDIFGKDKEPYLLDCAIMFLGILHQNMKYYTMEHQSNTSTYQVVRYSVKRMEKMVQELAQSNEQLNKPELLNKWLPSIELEGTNLQAQISEVITALRISIINHEEKERNLELLHFLQEELTHNSPREFLIESVIDSLKNTLSSVHQEQFASLDRLVSKYFNCEKGN